jgi:hypothetical protein
MKVLLSVLLVGSVVGCATDGLEGDPVNVEEVDVLDSLPDDQANEEETETASQESVSEGFVAGTGPANDDFGDEGPVDSNNRRRSLAAGLWQAILWADGAIEQDGTAFDASDIDCDFGPNTTAATRNWQARHGFSDVDGSAGRQTFGAADAQLKLFPTDGDVGPSTVVYVGTARPNTITMIRKEGAGSANHAYQAIGVDGRLRVISYGFISSCSSSFWLGS